MMTYVSARIPKDHLFKCTLTNYVVYIDCPLCLPFTKLARTILKIALFSKYTDCLV